MPQVTKSHEEREDSQEPAAETVARLGNTALDQDVEAMLNDIDEALKQNSAPMDDVSAQAFVDDFRQVGGQ